MDTIVVADMPSYGSTPLEKQVLSLAQEIISKNSKKRHFDINKFDFSQICCGDTILIIGEELKAATLASNISAAKGITSRTIIGPAMKTFATPSEFDKTFYAILGEKHDTVKHVLFDNCIDEAMAKEKPLNTILCQPTEYNLWPIVSTEIPMLIPGTTWLFILNIYTPEIRRQMYDMYASKFGSFDNFEFIVDKCVVEGECLVLNINHESNTFTDAARWHKL